MVVEQLPSRRRRIGEVLVEQGVLTQAQLETCLAAQQQTPPGIRRRRLGAVIIGLELASERQIATALAGAMNLELADLGRRPVDPAVVRLLPQAMAERHECLVLALDGPRIIVATSDPTNVVALDDIRLHTGATEVVLKVATATKLREALARAWSLANDSSGLVPFAQDEPEEIDEGLAAGVDAAPVVRLVNALLGDAVRTRASDVHIEPQQSELRVRYRVDGVLRQVMTVPRAQAAAVVSRIKIMAGLDIAERRRPQDGRSRIQADGTSVDVRISTLPTMHGEKVVLRLLARADDIPALDACGLTDEQLPVMRGALSSPQGLVIICGPTGSGKTSTLYAALQEISDIEHNVVTLEDPVELQLPGISQVQVHEASGLTFARGLRSVLRQDPDVVLVGEARDTETAELALQASLTGHLVLTTLHTNSAISAVTRLVEMGADAFLLASCLTLVVAQRLVRLPCVSCAAPYEPDPDVLHLLGLTLEDIESATPRRGAGCVECGDSGYRGRTGIFELLPVTEALRAVLHESPTEAAVGAAARESGVRTLRTAAVACAMKGVTTFEEALRVTHADTDVGLRCPGCTRVVSPGMVACPWCSCDLESGRCAGCERMLQPEWPLCPWCRTVARAAPARSRLADPD
ncbi:MAG: Flp pilus assembly complex ATPase component TadA [Actinomycetota bacterium]|nr:Flp pilus assembly complex ATPase component TadA [Actinomycetota bacterium]